MRPRRIGLMGIVALTVCGLAWAEEALELVNPGFEETQGEVVGVPSPDWEQEGAPPGWSVWYGESARASKAVMAWTAAVAHSGRRSVSVRSAAGPVVIMQQVPVEPGEVYAVRAWVRVSNPASTARVGCRWKAADGSWASSASVGNTFPDTVPAGEWAQVETVAQVPDNAAFLVIMLTGQDQGPDDACWFDDVTMARLTGEDLYVGPASSWLRPMLEPVDEPLVTPHLPWANPRAGGPLAVLFLLGNDHNIREAAELAQRLEMDYDVAFSHEFDGLLYALNDQEIRRKYAEGAYDVIVVGRRVGKNLVAPLRRYAERGKGVVLVGWPGMEPELPEVALAAAPADHYVAEALDAFPEAPSDPEMSFLRSLQVGEIGPGRVASIRWSVRARCLTPQVGYAEHLRMPHNYWEAFLATIARSVIWAAGRQPDAAIDLASVGDVATIRVTAGTAPLAGGIEWRQWTESGQGPITIGDGVPTFDLQPGQSAERQVDIGPIEAGPSFCVAILRDSEGKVLDFACTLTQSPTTERISAVELDAPCYAPGQTVHAEVSVEAADTPGLRLAASLSDAFGRELWRGEAPIAGDRAELSVPIGEPLTTAHRLRLELTDGRRVYDIAHTPVLAPLPPDDYFADWRMGTWGSGNAMPPYLDMAFCDALRSTGITSQLVGLDGMLASVVGRERPVGYGYGLVGTGPYDGESTVREPCFSDPQVRERNLTGGAESAGAQRPYGPIAAYLRDETSLVSGNQEVCSCAFCTERYQRWLRERYETIEALNAAWGTDYADFSEPGFVTDEDTRGADTWAPWVQFRRFMDWYWTESVELIRSGIRRGDPLIPVAYPNTFGPNPFCGRDYWQLAQVSEYSFEYVNEKRGSEVGSAHRYHYEAFRSFAPDIPHLPWVGYVFEPEAIEFAPWYCALHGARGVTIYGSMSTFAGNNSWAVLYPDLRPTRRGALYEEVTRELRGGLGKLLMSADERPAQVAILWSHPSMYVGWMLSDAEAYGQAGADPTDPYGARALSQAAWMRLTAGSGRQYRFLAEEQMPGGVEDFDCLVLPGVYALDGRVVQAARELLARGGTVIADLGVGLANEVGRPGARADEVAELFGFRPIGRPTWERREVILPGGAGPLSVVGFAELEPAGAEVVAEADGAPLILRKDHPGGGRAFYFNFATTRATELLAWLDSAEGPLAGLPRIARFGHALAEPGEYELVELRRGPVRLLGVLRDHRFGESVGPMTLALPAAVQAYDARAGRYLGRTDNLTADLRPGQGTVYALLPYRVTGVEVTGPERAIAGTVATLTAQVQSSAPTPGDHVLRVEVLDPAGAVSEAYSRNMLAKRGRAEIAIPFALNDAPGRWTVSVRDAATGVTGEVTVTLREG